MRALLIMGMVTDGPNRTCEVIYLDVEPTIHALASDHCVSYVMGFPQDGLTNFFFFNGTSEVKLLIDVSDHLLSEAVLDSGWKG